MSSNDNIEIHYINGKPVAKKKDISKEIKKDLKPDVDANPFDSLKRQLYNDLPQSAIKKDRSMTARALNQTLESIKNESKIVEIPTKSNDLKIFKCGDWEFKWYTKIGALKSTKKPENGYNLEYNSPNIVLTKNGASDKVYEIINTHITRLKS